MPLSDRLRSVAVPNWKVMLYGYPGSGKTVLAGRTPRPLFLDSENGTLSLQNHELGETPRIPVSSCKEVEFLAAEFQTNKDPLCDQIDTIVLDTISTLRTLEIQALVKQASTGSNRDADVPSQYEYNVVNSRITRMLFRLFATGKNVLLVAHIREESDEQGTVVLVRPGLSPTNSQAVMSLVDAAFFLEAEYAGDGSARRLLYTQPARRRLMKTRFALPSRLEDKDIETIWTRLEPATDTTTATILSI